jgi:hypothetical protein
VFSSISTPFFFPLSRLRHFSHGKKRKPETVSLLLTEECKLTHHIKLAGRDNTAFKSLLSGN